mgnify:CR=1 FL=1
MADLPFTLDQLRILRAIASEGSFKKAADSLYVTQPAVSLQIQNLEKQLDVALFDRGGRKAQLTEAGHLLLSYCDRILSQCQEACRALEDLHNLRGGSLIVGASQTTGTYLMPRMIGLFRQKYPDVAVQLQVHSTRRTGCTSQSVTAMAKRPGCPDMFTLRWFIQARNRAEAIRKKNRVSSRKNRTRMASLEHRTPAPAGHSLSGDSCATCRREHEPHRDRRSCQQLADQTP